ncbi:unnamed protein product [Mycena citricolor]|uniref:Alpha/beta-hydrolase n=1 Tax=Mycena citricolor TaxID=2018698 RepID=A0AAD2HS08_9AGAR|nr:unnamed protein product [Mycena citricolor]
MLRKLSMYSRLLVVTIAAARIHAQTDFDWQSLPATAALSWVPCYSTLQCAQLEVPLDYTSDAGNASIAIVRLPSTSPADQYKGPILFNPGGPGGSGVSAIVGVGQQFADFLGPEFDIVGFDPRGVANSRPAVSFFETAAERAFWTPPDLNLRYPSYNASPAVIPNQWAQYQLIGQQAVKTDTGDWLKHISTDNVARDMLEIVKAFGQDKLMYWGVSYGTVLGQTFATLFPDNVGRMVIDGVLDGEAWYSANLTEAMTDTDKTLQAFYDGCVAAGPAACDFYAPTAAEIAANLTSLVESIAAQPIPVLNNVSHGIIDFSWIRNLIFAATYSPYDSYSTFATQLAQLAAGQPDATYAAHQSAQFECGDDNTAAGNIFESEIATTCNDAVAVTDRIPELRAFYENEAKLSSFADIWAEWRVWCSGWRIHRPGRFSGPVGANTSYPLLVIGNTADPITPLQWARKASTLFPGSVLLTQNSPGHTSIVAASACTHGAMQAYFVNGTLPASGTVCQVDIPLFPPRTSARSVQGKVVDQVTKIADVVLPMIRRTR